MSTLFFLSLIVVVFIIASLMLWKRSPTFLLVDVCIFGLVFAVLSKIMGGELMPRATYLIIPTFFSSFMSLALKTLCWLEGEESLWETRLLDVFGLLAMINICMSSLF